MRCSKINRRRTEFGLFSLMAMEKPQAGRSQLGINKYYFQRNPSLRRASASSQRNPSLRSAVCIFAAESVAAMRGCIFAAESVAAKRGLHLRSGIRRCEANQTDAAIFAAFLRASSRLPTYMNALSGRSSPSPLQSRSKLSIVSSSEQVTPGSPVKTSPT